MMPKVTTLLSLVLAAATGLVASVEVLPNLRASVASDDSDASRRLDEIVLIVENVGCEANVESAKEFIQIMGRGALGSPTCLSDPVDGCEGGCCRIGSAYFICDAEGLASSYSYLPCVCNDNTALISSAQEAPTIDIVDTAMGFEDFNTLLDLVATAGLVDTLRGTGPFTVFAPVDGAFPSGMELEDFKNNTDMETLTSILTYHVVPGKIFSGDLTDGATVTTVQGEDLTISLANGNAMVNDANIVMADVEASNGVIHVIDAVLMPPQPNIVEVAIADGSFTTLVDLVSTAGLVETLSGTGPFTVLAPVDSAFPVGENLEEFKANTDLATLTKILTYHVIPGVIIESGDLVDGAEVTTAEGSTVTVSLDAATGGAMFNNANVIAADVPASNGIIHVIDTVLLPSTL